jgi:hypothetical protein
VFPVQLRLVDAPPALGAYESVITERLLATGAPLDSISSTGCVVNGIPARPPAGSVVNTKPFAEPVLTLVPEILSGEATTNEFV